jgi:ATP-dependent Clp protease ATP-binding subunit ClpC
MVFHALTKDEIRKIVDLELNKVSKRLEEHEIDLRATDAAREKLADEGYDPEMGARPLRRVIQNKVEDKLSDALLAGTFESGDTVVVDTKDEELILRPGEPAEQEDEPQEAIPAGG